MLLQHSHKYLGYLVFLLSIAQLVLVFAGARRSQKLAGIAEKLHRYGLLMVARMSVVFGAVLFFRTDHPMSSGWVWASLLLYGVGLEMIGGKFVAPELRSVVGGGVASGRLPAGALVQWVTLIAITGLMTVRPF